MKISDIKPENRPIEKMNRYGSQAVSNEELLAILINTGTRDKSAIDISYEIINSVESLSEILSLSIPELMKFKGMGLAKACRIEAAIELTRRLLEYHNRGHKIISAKDAIFYTRPFFMGRNKEIALVSYLNSNCQVMCHDIIDGATNAVSISENEIIKKCLKINARGIILAHNHPSGNVAPSKQDILLTKGIIEKLDVFNLILFDHIIVGHNNGYSFNEQMIISIND